MEKVFSYNFPKLALNIIQCQMKIERRDFVKLSASSAGGLFLVTSGCTSPNANDTGITDHFSDLKPMTNDIIPITAGDRLERVEKAKKLMRDNHRQRDCALSSGGTDFRLCGARPQYSA